jgi:hypothetical protein
MAFLGLFLLALAAVPAQVSAQTVSGESVSSEPAQALPYWTRGFDRQINALLDTGDDASRELALQLIIEMKTRYGDALDLQSVTDRVLRVYRSVRTDDSTRILALAALQSIDSPYGYEVLLAWYVEKSETSPRVHRTLRAVLQDYQMRHGIS